jgi:hypothetical protein
MLEETKRRRAEKVEQDKKSFLEQVANSIVEDGSYRCIFLSEEQKEVLLKEGFSIHELRDISGRALQVSVTLPEESI